MTTQSKFYYPVRIHRDAAQFPDVAPFVVTLPLPQSVEDQVAILGMSVGDQQQGLYVFGGTQWKFAMPMTAISASIIRGDALDIYINAVLDVTLPPEVEVYKNGYLQPGDVITHGNAVYAVRTPPTGGSGGGAVDSVNGQTGTVLINATNLPGLATVGKTGQYGDLIGAPGAYVLPIADANTLGGVIVPISSKLSINGLGNIDIGAAFTATVNGKISSVVNSGTGTSLISGIASSVVTLKSVLAGSGMSITDDGLGTLTLSQNQIIATNSVLGSVKVGSGISVAGDGTISVVPYILPVATASVLGGVKQGTGVSIAGDGTINNTYALPIATNLVLGGVKQGTGVSIAGDGTLSATYSLPVASASVLGGIKVGSGLSIAGDGTLSTSGSSVVTLTGDVTGTGTGTVPTVLTNSGITAGTYTKITVDIKGRATVGTQLASGDVTAALGFTPYNATNPNNYISANQNIAVTGDATGSGTTAITLTLAASGVSAGTYKSVTVDAKGRVTGGTNPTTLAGYGITDALNSISGGSVGGNITMISGATVTGLPTPVAGTDAVNKNALDLAIAGIVSGTSWHQNAVAATTGNITLSGLITVDGYVLGATDRVLVKNQTDPIENGIYDANAGAWTRSSDGDTGAEVKGMAILILNGTTNALTQWVNTNSAAITIGTTPITYTALIAGATSYTAGTGLTLNTNQFSITNTGVVAGTYTKVTVNAQGQVTTGAQIASSDVTTALGFTPYNSTNPSGYISANQIITFTGDSTGSGTTAVALTLANSGVTAGTFTKITVDAKGRATVGAQIASSDITTALGFTPYNATNPSNYISANQNITFTGDATGSGITSVALTLSNSGVVAGTYTKVTVDSKGRVTVGANPTTLAGYGITDALSNTGGSVGGTLTFTAGTVTGLAAPSANTDAATKLYTDTGNTNTFNSVAWKTTAVAATTANITLSGLQSIDGFSVAVGDRVLVKNQTTASENGVYLAASGAWTRTTDTASGATLRNMIVLILNGSTLTLTQWANTNSAAITIGTTSVTFGQVAGASSPYTAGTGLTLSTNQFSITNTGVAASTYKSVTVNAQGQVTAGTNPTTLVGFGITDALSNTGGSVGGNITFTTGTVTGLPTPSASSDSTPKVYVDTLVSNTSNLVAWKSAVAVATTANITLSGTQTIDGYAVVATDRVLVKNQTTASENGIYVAAAGAWTRAVDADAGTEIKGMSVLVLNGTVGALSQWFNTNANAITVGSTSITYSQIVSPSSTITLSGDVTGSGTSAITATLANSGVVAGTYTKITVDAKGRATVGAQIASSDVTTALGYTPQQSSSDLNQITALGAGVTLGILSKSAGANADPSYASVALLVHGNGTNGSTSFPDTSANVLTPSSVNGVTVSTARQKFNSGSMLLAAGANVGINYASNALFNIGQTNYTIECWINPTDVSSGLQQTIFNFTGAGAQNPYCELLGNTIYLRSGNTGPELVTPVLHGMSVNNWYHLAITKTGSNWNLFINGTSISTGTSATVVSENKQFSIGSGSAITSFTGYIQEMRLTPGIVRYPANFTAPTLPFADSVGGSSMWTFGPSIATNSVNFAPIVTLASAATLAIGAAAANDISVTGTTNVTAFDAISSGAIRKLTFTGILTLTHNATSLILPGAANITTAAGDVTQFTSLGGGNWRCDFYTRAAGSGFVTLAGTETLSNKTLTGPVVNAYTEGGATGSGTSFTPDITAGTDFEYTTTGNISIALPTAVAGKSYTVTVIYGGAHTVTFTGGTLIKWANNGTQPTSTSVAGKYDVYVFKCNRAGTATLAADGGRNF